MRRKTQALRFCLLCLSVILAGQGHASTGANGSSAVLSIATGSASAGTTVSLPVSFSGSGNSISALQWTINYSAGDFANVDVSVGPPAAATSKSVQCSAASAGQYACVVMGLNQDAIADGVIATVNLTVSAGTTNSSSTILLTNALATTPDGITVPLAGNASNV